MSEFSDLIKHKKHFVEDIEYNVDYSHQIYFIKEDRTFDVERGLAKIMKNHWLGLPIIYRSPLWKSERSTIIKDILVPADNIGIVFHVDIYEEPIDYEKKGPFQNINTRNRFRFFEFNRNRGIIRCNYTFRLGFIDVKDVEIVI